jgi:hypothetical protein
MAHSAAIEVHGQDANIVGNHIRGYYRGINIVCSRTTFSHNDVVGALNPVDLWSVVAPGLATVALTHNTLNRNLAYWAPAAGQRAATRLHSPGDPGLDVVVPVHRYHSP